MFQFSQSLQFDHPAADVWPYLIAFEQVPLWEHGVVEVRLVTAGLPDIGTEISARRLYGGRESQVSGRIVAYEEGRSATMSLRGGPLGEVYAEYTVEPIGDRSSVVTFRARGNLIRPLRFLHPVLPALGRAESRKNLAKLKRRIEAGIEPRSPSTTPAPDR